jgi:ureidoglycolate lyase
VVIGKPAKYVDEPEALAHVAGYCVVNDLSERAFQLEGTGQWVKGKSADTFGPIGPWLIRRMIRPADLGLAQVDGQHISEATRHMFFRRLPRQLHQSVRRPAPGDVISTSTTGHRHGSATPTCRPGMSYVSAWGSR